MSVPPPPSRKAREQPRETPARVPLWREVIAVETELRPTVPVSGPSRHAPIPYLPIAFTLLVTGTTSVVGSIVLYRAGLVRGRMQRAPALRGAPIATLRQLLRPRIAVSAWQNGAAAFGCAVGVWLIVFAVRRARRFALRWGFIPALLGAGGWLGAAWWMLRRG